MEKFCWNFPESQILNIKLNLFGGDGSGLPFQASFNVKQYALKLSNIFEYLWKIEVETFLTSNRLQTLETQSLSLDKNGCEWPAWSICFVLLSEILLSEYLRVSSRLLEYSKVYSKKSNIWV